LLLDFWSEIPPRTSEICGFAITVSQIRRTDSSETAPIQSVYWSGSMLFD